MQIVPYSFNTTTLPQSQQGLATLPGYAQGVYIVLPSDYQWILNKFIAWFSDFDEVELIDHGISDKQGFGYIILEWYECEVDRLFLAILQEEESVGDYTVYTRDL